MPETPSHVERPWSRRAKWTALLFTIILPLCVIVWMNNGFIGVGDSRRPSPMNEREIATITIRPQRFLQNPYTWSTRFDRLVPSHLAPSQLAAVGVDSLSIRAELGDVNDSIPARSDNRIRWSVVAKLEKPLEPADFFDRWQSSTVMRSNPIPVDTLKTDQGQTYLRVPAGTFLAPAVRSGELHYEDAQEKRLEHGINVGYVDPYWEFVEGGSQHCAVFHFSGLTTDDLTESHLHFRLLCCDFRIVSQDQDLLKLHVQVRNRKSGLKSDPMVFDVKSHEEFQFAIPRSVSVDSGGNESEADLLSDFITAGELDVLLWHDKPARYLGVGKNSLQIQSRADECLAILDDTVFVADRLESLLSLIADPTARDHPPLNHDLICSAYIDTPEKKLAVERMLNGDACMDLDHKWFQAIHSFRAQCDGFPTINLHVELGTGGMSIANNKKQCAALIDQWKDQRVLAVQANHNFDAGSQLLLPLIGGRPTTFPTAGRLDADRKSKILDQYLSTTDTTAQFHFAADRIAIDFSERTLPFHSEPERSAFLANVQFAWASDQLNNHRYELSSFGIEQSLAYLPDDTTLRFRIAHQRAFNTSVEFRREAAYRWIRSGLAILLDEIEADPESCDGYWSAAKVISHKLTLDEVRPHFVLDEELQNRLRILVGNEESNQDWNPDGWLVARRLLQRAIDCYERSGSAGQQVPILLYSDEAKTHAGYAKFLAEQGKFEESQQAWRSALKQYERLADRRIISVDSIRYRLRDIVTLIREKPRNDKLIKHLNREWLRTEFELQHGGAKLHLKPAMREADQAFFDARQSLAKGNKQLAATVLKDALEKLADAQTDDTESMVFAHCIESEWRLYQWLSGAVEGNVLSTTDLPAQRTLKNAFEKLGNHKRFSWQEIKSDTTPNE